MIEELQSLVQRAVRVPATGKILLDEAAVRQILEQMHSTVPDEVRLGQRIASERERILADARAHARRLAEEGQAQLNTRLDDEAVVQAARQRAHQIETEAEQRAARLGRDADQYVSGQLAALETRLQRLLREVQNGQRALAGEPGGSTEGGGQS